MDLELAGNIYIVCLMNQVYGEVANTVYLTVNGIKKPASEWSEVTGISSYTIYWLVKKKGKEYAEQRISEKI